MKVVTLVENTAINDKLKALHGLSLYIETGSRKLLVDTGNGDVFLKNAEALGVDISKVDTLIITHGHSDHGGGLEAFLRVNGGAKVYIQRTAFLDYYSKIVGFARVDIGLDKQLAKNDRVILLDGNFKIDDDICLFTNPTESRLLPRFNATLFQKVDKRLVKDRFVHEQNVLIFGEKTLLIGGCAHRGIVNIIDEAYRFSQRIDYTIGGFHLVNPVLRQNEKEEVVKELANKLSEYDMKYYTCHCTGLKPYEILKSVLGQRIDYLSTGTVLEL